MTVSQRLRFGALAVVFSTLVIAAPAGVTLIGRGSIPGTTLDLSGLTGDVCSLVTPANCIPQATFGGFGSSLTYTGHDGVFMAAADRGPFDGLTNIPYLVRFHFLHITVDTTKRFPNIDTVLLDTRFYKNEASQKFVGGADAFNVVNPLATLRLDPEATRVSHNGTFFISDEYGPYILEFDRQGNLVNRIAVPVKFLIANPNADPNLELTGNTSGRQANRGMEGLAITPDGTALFGIMQNALIQDHGLSPGTTNRLGVNNRILKVDLSNGQTSEYVYVLDSIGNGTGANEMLAINDHQFLVIERDNRIGLAAVRKKIYKIDVTGATDVSGVASLPASGAALAGMGITPVSKTLFIDMLDPAFGLASTMPEKLEGLAWGPDLPDGRHVLYVINDNDLVPANGTQIYAFAVDGAAAGLDYQPQVLPGPMFPPGQVKKIVGK